jgi:hypothetical protein
MEGKVKQDRNIRISSLFKKFALVKYYWIKGIVIGYLNTSPFEAFTLAIIMQITFRMTKKTTIGIPTIIKQRGIDIKI